MHSHAEASTFGRTRLSFADEAEIDEFVRTLDAYERGELTPDQWRAFRLVRGTYGQRQTGDAQMLRIKIPQGILDGPQLVALADVAERYSRGFGHITTRQNVQLHFLKLHDVEPVMRRLAEAGLTTREACGSAVRNITACPYAGVAADEAFDVTPYAEALTRHLLRQPLSSKLPRKFKIGFEGCPEDHALAAINDIGLRARVHVNGSARRGFRVTVAGSTSILPTSGHLLFEFLPAGEIFDLADAVMRLYAARGDYKHKQRNRLKFLIREMGWEAWRAEFERTFAEVKAEGGSRLPFDPDDAPVEQAPSGTRPAPPRLGDTAARAVATELRGPGFLPRVEPQLSLTTAAFARWARGNVRPQKQAGYAVATVTVPLGDLTSAQLRVLADLAASFSDGTLRMTPEQNLLFRWVPETALQDLHRQLAAAGLASPHASTIADPVSCPGAEACRLAVTQSRGLARLIHEHVAARPGLVDDAADLNVKISGCPNGCGQHHIAGVGFQGSVRKLDGRAVPQYFVMVGGGVTDGQAHFARIAAKVPARRSGEALERLVGLYKSEGLPGETAKAFFRRVEIPKVKALLADLEALTAENARPTDFQDLGEDGAFEVATLEGECSA
ncbi:MAG TPA: nitrite/sulfite reductase [Vicinamibacteria bacterium]|jgi:sulfite reductase (NADPH) hemoprotein beta-component